MNWRWLAAALVMTGIASAQLAAKVASTTGPSWISYRQAIIPGQHQMCNWEEQRKLLLEGAKSLIVLLRVEQGKVQKIRTATEACEVDSGGLPLEEMQVAPAESVSFLAGFRGQDSAMHAISLHAEGGAVGVLVKMAREEQDPKVRGRALFWLAQTAQSRLVKDELIRAVEQDPETEVKKSAVFALSRLPNGEGIPKLMELAKANRNPEVRKQSMFWLGQSKDPRAIDFFEQILKGR